MIFNVRAACLRQHDLREMSSIALRMFKTCTEAKEFIRSLTLEYFTDRNLSIRKGVSRMDILIEDFMESDIYFQNCLSAEICKTFEIED